MIFLISLSESLAVVGLFVPGTIVMFAIGALVALGAYPLDMTLLMAMLGAVVGDGISYWLGAHFKERLRDIWPMSRYPQLFDKGNAFFERHGGKSVLIGRFAGPVRPIIPVVAGMMGMPAGRFYVVNVVSAILWAPAYILPGVVFAASLGLAAEVATRLVVLVLMLVLVIWLLLWLTRRIYLFMEPRANVMLMSAIRWMQRHPIGGRLVAAVIDPHAPEFRGLIIWAMLLVLMVTGFGMLLSKVLVGMPLPLDYGLWRFMQEMRTPWADHLMIMITSLGDGVIGVTVFAVIGLWLLWARRWLAFAHLFAAMMFAFFVPILLKEVLELPRPMVFGAGVTTYGFPSWHATMNTVLYGFLAVMVAREMSESRRWLAYAGAALVVLLITFPRLYLGVHWISDVLGGIALGMAWVAVLGIAYRRHVVQGVSRLSVLGAILVAWCMVWPWHLQQQHVRDEQRYQFPQTEQQWVAEEWWTKRWAELPQMRIDMLGKARQPFNLQWQGAEADLHAYFTAHGWREPVDLNLRSALHWLLTDSNLEDLPVLPQVYDGRHEKIVRVRPTDDPHRFELIRLWRTSIRFADGSALWIGYAGHLVPAHPFGVLSVPRLEIAPDAAMTILANDLAGFEMQAAAFAHPLDATHTAVVLLRPSARSQP
ncbi:MAG: VTT domain-containing protein [Pseudomonadota bacterium]